MSAARRGSFATMDPAKQREIARRGGRAVQAKGTGHRFTADEAREAGRKGGEKIGADGKYMASIGRRGGKAKGKAVDAEALARERAAQVIGLVGDLDSALPAKR